MYDNHQIFCWVPHDSMVIAGGLWRFWETFLEHWYIHFVDISFVELRGRRVRWLWFENWMDLSFIHLYFHSTFFIYDLFLLFSITAPMARFVISRIVALNPPADTFWPGLTSDGVIAFALAATVGPLLFVLFAASLLSLWALLLAWRVVGTV